MSMFNPPHPGRLILEYVIDHGDSVAALAQRLDLDVLELTNVIDGCFAIYPAMAKNLEAELGISADLWLRMQAAYDSVFLSS
ncbi:MAG: HigA family addiction module antitoxin [Plesiomonas sp.]|uniref:HigA family addiction module antitoxin n=1 Tax=Plesiomonas sp. TaxID=2486279 RepID=UPI003F392697